MRTKTRRTIALVGVAGLASQAPGGTDDRRPEPGLRGVPGIPVGHIYYHPGSGERVITPYDLNSRDTSNALWISNNTDPCATGGTVGVIDDPDLDGDGMGELFGGDCDTGMFPCEGEWHNWWGDISFDTVVDCVVTLYGTYVPDLDEDDNSIGDGVVGCDLYISFSDNDNGFGSDFPGLSGRSCILEFNVPTLPGYPPSPFPMEFAAVYRLTIDFADTAPSLVFELGDSDGIDDAGTGLSGAALYGPANGYPQTSGQDIDGDGLADFSFGFRFDQTALGISGDPGVTKGVIGYVSAAPKEGNPGDLPPHPADATGLFDSVDIYSAGPSCPPDETTEYIGTFFFGGFSCDDSGPFSSGTPHASCYMELYGPSDPPSCEADFDDSGPPADFADVLTFLTDFAGACSDGVGNFDYSSGGVPNNCDFTDVLAFLSAFSSPICGSPP